MTDRRLAAEAWESLFRAQHEIFGEISADFEGATLTNSEYDVLLTVVRSPGLQARLRNVTANLLISQPSVSRLVDRMVVDGLVEKLPDPDDGRGAIVRATPKAAAAFRKLATAHATTIAERMSVLSDEELAELLALTRKLRDR
ncbi:MarR family winged helix-turn-helix transcriptional regulator [Microbacterium fluvii]|uniref:MarR family winged helix-turn-helix transcriptional regulator n=1 Tax=Microbacterium fluvii TaxID=415215 RepID=A0ABW2HFF6_9MICO|nr:MarR family transcriptional regulator [Microbacterium fluvii]MCU4673329.1 MarR family transcriptional regulator [Microbacterium fluvii]